MVNFRLKRRGVGLAATLGIYLLIVSGSFAWARASIPHRECPIRQTVVLVDTWPNWTLGCVAVGTWSEISTITTWVSDAQATEILLL